jgi:hypothetical protein
MGMGRPQDPVPAGNWYVLVETGGGNGQQPAIMDTRPFHTREEALAKAADLTRTYMKPKVAKEKGRWIYRTGPDSWLVLVTRFGTRPFFRVWVAYLEQWISDAEGQR